MMPRAGDALDAIRTPERSTHLDEGQLSGSATPYNGSNASSRSTPEAQARGPNDSPSRGEAAARGAIKRTSQPPSLALEPFAYVDLSQLVTGPFAAIHATCEILRDAFKAYSTQR
jgi:hypothetical protein